jgi:hypothetical protein
MRILTALSLAAAMLVGAVAHAHHSDGRGAKAIINRNIKFSSKVADKTGPFKTKLGGKAGDRLRPFTASNVRSIIIPGRAPAGALGGARVHVGGIARGTIDLKAHKISIKGYSMVR